MATISLLIILVIEIGFTVSEFLRKPLKKEWISRRLLLCIAEMAFLLLLLLPGTGSSIRYKGLAGLLVIRLIIALISFLVGRKNEKPKKRVTIVLSCIGGIIIFAMSMLPAFVIRDYNGRETTGEYEFAQAQAILIDENRVETFEIDGSYREVPVHFYNPSFCESHQCGYETGGIR